MSNANATLHTDQNPSFSIGENFHTTGEHGPQHVVVLRQRADRRVVERPSHVELDVLQSEKKDHRPPSSNHLYVFMH